MKSACRWTAKVDEITENVEKQVTSADNQLAARARAVQGQIVETNDMLDSKAMELGMSLTAKVDEITENVEKQVTSADNQLGCPCPCGAGPDCGNKRHVG